MGNGDEPTIAPGVADILGKAESGYGWEKRGGTAIISTLPGFLISAPRTQRKEPQRPGFFALPGVTAAEEAAMCLNSV